jgi:protein SCO1
MQPVQKVLTTMLWACAVLAMVSVIGANLWRDRTGRGDAGAGAGATTEMSAAAADEENPDQPLRVTRDVPAFSLIDQNDKPVTLQTLKGKPFIANFIFTHCQGPCPVMTAKMATLQKSVPADVRLISFSVDPAQDRPDVLKSYAAQFAADDARWHFLTVADPANSKDIYDLAQRMLLAAQPADEVAKTPVIHSEEFVLVDGEGVIRSYYNSGSATQMEQLKSDARDLVEVPPPGKE